VDRVKWGLPICKVFGIRIRLHATFLLLVLWAMWAGGVEAGAQGMGWAVGLVMAAFVCVALHELGHSVVAQRLGVQVSSITLLPIGGVAALRSIPEKPSHEIAITLAGPLVNVAIFGVLFVVAWYAPFEVPPLFVPYYWGLGLPRLPVGIGELLGALLFINQLMVLFNLIPAYPMDGGRLLRAMLAVVMPFARATAVAANVGRGIAALFVAVAFLWPELLVFGIIGVLIFFAAGSEQQAIRLRSILRGATVGQVMMRDFVRVTPETTAAECFEKIYRSSQDDFPVMADGRLLGLLGREAVVEAVGRGAGHMRAGDLMQTVYHSVQPDAALEMAHEQMRAGRRRTFPVVSEEGVVGLLTAENVQRYFAAQVELEEGGRRRK